MNNIKKIVAGVAGILATTTVFGGPNESATLNAVVSAGALEIDATSISGTHSPVGGAVSLTGTLQSDALVFNIDGITINDLNGDGLGWILTATPAANLTSGGDSLPIGTTAGFNNASDAVNTTVDTANQITYGSGTGIAGYTIDYDVAYDVPALVGAGTYAGTVAFAIVAN